MVLSRIKGEQKVLDWGFKNIFLHGKIVPIPISKI